MELIINKGRNEIYGSKLDRSKEAICSIVCSFPYVERKVKVPHYRLGQALGVPGV